ncbi:GNAT family N-acetyltransferase [Nioella ostreopsis]|uniref:GNAT family N-acetyltransferase n=1 Tax=Nioella ostreopsis TaxID=2448479 RepID=UPI000FDC5358|nr:GNAT family N-acetyltransferase [Nioella ostreopsis]
MTVTNTGLFDICEATWPAASITRIGPWLVRDGQGAGKRVSSVTAEGDWRPEDIAQAEQACRDMGQDLLFQIRPEDAALDTVLAEMGYEIIDPVDFLVAPVETLTADLHRLAAIPCWPPLAVQTEIWAEGGIGPARMAVMDRAAGPKTALLGRHNDHPVATAFVAIHNGTAMLHALEVLPEARRMGIGRTMMRGAANWAARHNARDLAVLVVKANKAAQTLYAGLGMTSAGAYHYRIKKG